MTIEDIELDQEVMCVKLFSDFIYVGASPDLLFFNREIGHIGTVNQIFPNLDTIYVSHTELNKDGDRVEFLTLFKVEEVELFKPTQLEKTPLGEAINKNLIQITRLK